MPVAVHVVAGFLGAGKTTVLRHLLAAVPGSRNGLVVNDFGDAAIDQDVLGGDALREIRGSCVCCTAPEGFVGAVGELVDQGVDRIFVEPTGLARPADVIDTLRRAPYADRMELRPLVVVVDPAALARGDVPADVLEQGAVADVVVANRLDRCSDEDLGAFRAWVAGLWPGPHTVVETRFGRVEATILDWPAGAGPRAVEAASHRHDHGHDHAFEVRTWVWPPDVVFHRARLRAALVGLGALRAKGLFRTEEGTVLLQIAGGELSEEASGRRSDSRVDVIVRHADGSLLDGVGPLLEDARLRPDEALVRGTTLEVALPDGATRTFDRAALVALPEGVPDVSTRVPGRAGSAARLWQVLRAAGAPAEGEAVVVAIDGYVTAPVPVGSLRDALLVHSLGDGALPDPVGGPFRLLIPGDAGPGGPCANVKGVVRIALRGLG